MDTSSTNEIEATAGRLIGLDLQLRRHHYHSSDENAEPLDLIDQQLHRGDQSVPLTSGEFALLKIFVEHPRRVHRHHLPEHQ